MKASIVRAGAPRALATLMLLSGLVSLAGVGCGSAQSEPVQAPSDSPGALDSSSEAKASLFITLGDIEPEEPLKKVKRFQPLAEYLAQNLRDFGVDGGRVAIARDVEEMGRFMRDGTVDVYFDSSFPTLSVQELSGSKVILRRWKSDTPSYWSTYVALGGNGISSVDDFVGRVMAFEEPHSTSGFVLPAGTLIQRGFTLKEVDSPETAVAADVIGYIFAQDEKNTFEYLLQGVVSAGGVSNQDYDKLPEELKQRIISLDRTVSVPRQLVSVRPGLDSGVVAQLRKLLIGLEDTDEGQLLLQGLKNTRRFDALSPESRAALGQLKKLMDLVAKN